VSNANNITKISEPLRGKGKRVFEIDRAIDDNMWFCQNDLESAICHLLEKIDYEYKTKMRVSKSRIKELVKEEFYDVTHG